MSRRPLKRGSLIADASIVDVLAEDQLGYSYIASIDTQTEQPNSRRVLREYFPLNLASRNRDTVVSSESEQKARLFRSGLARVRGYQIEAPKLTNSALVRTGGTLDENGTTYSIDAITPTHTLGGFVAERGSISPVNIRSVLLFLAQGLEDLEAHGLVHGVICDSTVIRNDVGQFLLGGLEHTQLSKLSRADAQQLRGLNAYSAPELSSGSIEEIGPWTDIYGLGAIAHLALLGTPPPDLRARKSGGASLSFGSPQTEAENDLHALLANCLDLSTVNRPQSASEFRSRLLSIDGLAATRIGGTSAVAPLPVSGPKPQPSPEPTDRGSSLPVSGQTAVLAGAAAAVVLLGAGLLLFGGSRKDAERPAPVQNEVAAPDVTPDTASAQDPQVPINGDLDTFVEEGLSQSPDTIDPDSDTDLQALAERREWLALDREDADAIRAYLAQVQSVEMAEFARNKLAELDRTAWETATEAGGIGDYQTYLDRFPADVTPPGAFAARADAQITQLSAEADNLERETRRQLQRLGYSLEADIVADKRRLIAAVRRYQSTQNLAVTGELSRPLLTDIANTIAAAEEATRRAEAEARAAELEAQRAAEDAAAEAARQRREAADAALLARETDDDATETQASTTTIETTAPARPPGSTFSDCETCPTMVVLPAGRYRQGSPSGEAGRLANEGPQREITIAAPFAVSQTEITVGTFQRYLTATGRSVAGQCASEDRNEPGVWAPVDGRSFERPGYNQSDAHPAVCVTWSDAKRYIDWLSDQTGERYRLLTEAEWEYAARAGEQAPYPWGGDPDAACTHGNVADRSAERSRQSWQVAECRDGSLYPTPVGDYRANTFGLHDMIGNVWEWVEDCFDTSYANVPENGSANTASGCRYRVIRGGSWASSPSFLRSAYRSSDRPTARYDMLGFRIARDL